MYFVTVIASRFRFVRLKKAFYKNRSFVLIFSLDIVFYEVFNDAIKRAETSNQYIIIG